jgi:hypothetical protein
MRKTFLCAVLLLSSGAVVQAQKPAEAKPRVQPCSMTVDADTQFTECDMLKLSAIVQRKQPLLQQIDNIDQEASKYIEQLLEFYGPKYTYEPSQCGRVPQGTACFPLGRIILKPVAQPPAKAAPVASPVPPAK